MSDTPNIKDMVMGNGFTMSKDDDGICYSAHAYAKPATAEDLEKDAEGITNPNLHRRIDNDLPESDTPTSPITQLQTFTGDGEQTVFTLDFADPIDSIAYILVNGDYIETYSVSSDNKTITFNSAPANRSGIEVYYIVMFPSMENDVHSLLLSGTNSYRYTLQHTYIEDSTTSEIP